jgi:pilus assembly protein Flp/PilA
MRATCGPASPGASGTTATIDLYKRRRDHRFIAHRNSAILEFRTGKADGLKAVCVSLSLCPFTKLATMICEETMRQFLRRADRFIRSEDGPTAVEYAVMLALIIVVCLLAIQSLGSNTKTSFTNTANSLGS